MDKKTPPKSDTLSSQVLEYFRKYSRDQNLANYLRGIAQQYENKTQTEIDVNKPVHENLVLQNNDKEKIDQTIDKESNMSPTSSLTSNRKLEWDNGADIGYENSNNRVNLHKSFSLPTLTTLEKIELGKKPLLLPLHNNLESSAYIYYPSSDSNSDTPANPPLVSTTTSYSPEEQKLESTTSSSFAFKPWSSETTSDIAFTKENFIKFAHEKVGSPVAQSTPNIEHPLYEYKRQMFVDTLLPEERDKASSITIKSNGIPFTNPESDKMVVKELKCIAKFTKSKIVRLAVTKPIWIDCVNYKQYNDKDIQTVKCVEFCSIGVQTEDEKNEGSSEKFEKIPYNMEKQVVEYIKYSDSTDQPSSRSLGTNTMSDLASNCNSFEYLCRPDMDDVRPKTSPDKYTSQKLSFEKHSLKIPNLGQSSSEGIKSKDSHLNCGDNSKNSEETSTRKSNSEISDNQFNSSKSSLNLHTQSSGKTLSSNVTEVSSKNTPLGEMISCNLSSHLNMDIEKSIFLLQRLLKSKRYDKVTKEYFVKKIVDKILKSNYSSDSSSSSNKGEEEPKGSDHNIHCQEREGSICSKVSEKLVEPSLKRRLQKNVPWVPVTFSKYVAKPKTLEIKTFSSDIFPDNKQERKVKDSRFTITSSMFDQQQKTEADMLNYFRSGRKIPWSSSTTHSKHENKPQKSDMRTWKDDTTQSEKIFEARYSKFDGDKTDSLVKFAKKERENQLNWINNEIFHLNKLKTLLQENHLKDTSIKTTTIEKPNIEIEVLTKPHIQDMKKMKQSAAVYVITTDKTTNRNSSRSNNYNVGTFSVADNKNVENISKNDLPCNRISFAPDMKEAKLVSSEVYKSDEPFTCIRRYVFEIPVQCLCDTLPCKHILNGMKAASTSRPKTDVGVDPDKVVHKDSSTEKLMLAKETLITSENDSNNKPAIDSRQASFISTNTVTKGVQVSDKEFVDNKREAHNLADLSSIPLVAKYRSPRSIDVSSRGTFVEADDIPHKETMLKETLITTETDSYKLLLNKASMENQNRMSSISIDKLTKSTQASDIGSLDNKRRVHSVAEVSHLPLTAKNIITPENTNELNRNISEGFANIVLDKRKDSSEISNGINIEHRIRQPSVDFQDVFVESDEISHKKSSTEEPILVKEALITTEKDSERFSFDKSSMTDPKHMSSSTIDKLTKGIQASDTEFVDNKRKVHSVAEVSHFPSITKHVIPRNVNASNRSNSEELASVMLSRGNGSGEVSITTNTDHRFRQPSVHFQSIKSPPTEYKGFEQRSKEFQESPSEQELPRYIAAGKPAPDYQEHVLHYQTPAADYGNTGANYQRSQLGHKKYVTPTSSTSSMSTTSGSQTILIKICPCCKRKNSKYPSVLQNLSNKIENSLCQPCHMYTSMVVDPTTGKYNIYPDHVCKCYTSIKTDTVNKIKQTVKHLEQLQNEDLYCNCSQKECKCATVGKSKRGIAYTLTLEDEDASESSEQERQRSLDEIRLKIPGKRKHRSKKHHYRKHHRKYKSPSRMTLQEYLCTNRPNFVQNVEERRKMLIELAYMREQRCQKYKQLLAMTNGVLPNDSGDQNRRKGLYTSKEMRKITAKNYKKLPEVQRKLEERHENDTRRANRFLAHIFNKKIQQNTLKGKVDLSTTTSVIKFI